MKNLKTKCGMLLSFFLLGWSFGCGKPPAELPGKTADELVPVQGSAAFASQCPYGSLEKPIPSKVELWACPLKLNEVALSETIDPLTFQADCKKKTITIRTYDRTSSGSQLDTTWEVMPDGSFDVTLEPSSIKLKSDGAGQANCSVPVRAQIFGKLECLDRDKVTIQFQVVWRNQKPDSNGAVHGGSPHPNASPSPIPAHPGTPGTSCKLPDTCYFYAKADVRQCQ